MDNKDQPAFAAMSSSANGTRAIQTGLSKREYMATHILSGHLASANPGPISDIVEYWAKESVRAADALLKALEQSK